MSYKAQKFLEKGGPLHLVEEKIPEPGKEQVLVKVEACGICHSDTFVQNGLLNSFPRCPGHEVVGVITKVGEGAKRWKVGDRVGRGWHGGHCWSCDACLSGEFIHCDHMLVTGGSDDGGYAEYMLAPWHSLAAVPPELKSEEAAPLLCAGVTVFNSMRNMKVRSGSLVAVQGVGGLGHLAIQYANKMGFKVVAISTSNDKKDLSIKLGAHAYIDTSKVDAAAELQKMGGAKMIVATGTSGKAISPLIGGLTRGGILLVLGATPDPITVSPFQILARANVICGWPSGTARDSEDTLKFAALHNIRTMVETYPLTKANEGIAHMLSNKARFRAVLVMHQDEQKSSKDEHKPAATHQ